MAWKKILINYALVCLYSQINRMTTDVFESDKK